MYKHLPLHCHHFCQSFSSWEASTHHQTTLAPSVCLAFLMTKLGLSETNKVWTFRSDPSTNKVSLIGYERDSEIVETSVGQTIKIKQNA